MPRLLALLLLMPVVMIARSQTVMTSQERKVETAAELAAAAAAAGALDIVVAVNLTGLPTLYLSPGKTLKGAAAGITLGFAAGQDGIQLSSDNGVENLELHTDVNKRALFNDTKVGHLGRLVLRNLRTVGSIELLARDRVRGGHVEAENIYVKGVVVKLSAVALSIKPGGSARRIAVAGGLVTHGAGVNPLELHGTVDSLQITEGLSAAGGGFEGI